MNAFHRWRSGRPALADSGLAVTLRPGLLLGRLFPSPLQLSNQPPLLLWIGDLEFLDCLRNSALCIRSVNATDDGRRGGLDQQQRFEDMVIQAHSAQAPVHHVGIQSSPSGTSRCLERSPPNEQIGGSCQYLVAAVSADHLVGTLSAYIDNPPANY
jgi:hypothetical protein